MSVAKSTEGPQRSRTAERAFKGLAAAATFLPLIALAGLLGFVFVEALPRLNLDFVSGWPSRKAEQAGILPGVVGSIWVVVGTTLLAVPIGVGAAVYLEEYAKKSWWTTLVEVNVANLAGVPSILFGLLGLEVFVRAFSLKRSVAAGACTLALLVLPVVITASREALRAVPGTLREAALALGATRLSVVRRVVLPLALPGILTGAILAVARALGETAPLIVVGALNWITFLPDGPRSPFTVLPIQIYDWISRPQLAFRSNAAAGILVLLSVLLVLNGGAIWMRDRAKQRLGAGH